jgi:hypothetical protein
VTPFDPNAYGPAVAALLQRAPLCPLGPAKPHAEVSKQLAALDDAALFPGRKVVDREMVSCCLAGLWLLFDFLDESHAISQDVHTASGSYWHGIMHRREPDYANAKYWFRRAGNHPVFEPLRNAAAELAAASGARGAKQLAEQSQWDAFRFVELCEEAAGTGAELESLCRQIAQLEWRLLFDHCYRCAAR